MIADEKPLQELDLASTCFRVPLTRFYIEYIAINTPTRTDFGGAISLGGGGEGGVEKTAKGNLSVFNDSGLFPVKKCFRGL